MTKQRTGPGGEDSGRSVTVLAGISSCLFPKMKLRTASAFPSGEASEYMLFANCGTDLRLVGFSLSSLEDFNSYRHI